VMLYQMLTGNIPRGAFKSASVLIPGLDPRFDAIIDRAMQPERSDRQQTAAELRRELDVIMTVPLVGAETPMSAAIPVAKIALAPGKRSAAPKPLQRSAGDPVRKPASGARATAASPNSKTPLLIGIGVSAVA